VESGAARFVGRVISSPAQIVSKASDQPAGRKCLARRGRSDGRGGRAGKSGCGHNGAGDGFSATKRVSDSWMNLRDPSMTRDLGKKYRSHSLRFPRRLCLAHNRSSDNCLDLMIQKMMEFFHCGMGNAP
jgi:hypothetical protein